MLCVHHKNWRHTHTHRVENDVDRRSMYYYAVTGWWANHQHRLHKNKYMKIVIYTHPSILDSFNHSSVCIATRNAWCVHKYDDVTILRLRKYVCESERWRRIATNKIISSRDLLAEICFVCVYLLISNTSKSQEPESETKQIIIFSSINSVYVCVLRAPKANEKQKQNARNYLNGSGAVWIGKQTWRSWTQNCITLKHPK